MPYPESCPECGGAFRNTGTHYTARRNEVGRHVLLELGCQNTQRRYWWDFTSGTAAEDSTTPGRRAAALGAFAQQTNGHTSEPTNGHVPVATLEQPLATSTPTPAPAPTPSLTRPPTAAPAEDSRVPEPVVKLTPTPAETAIPKQPATPSMHVEPAPAAIRAKPVVDE